ncbi:MAG: hypothetical protein IJU98_04955 [Synergistaceae bacterium]|nr:hypothetical protein [Synergistaceae bacterium]
MIRPTENVFKELNAFLDAHREEIQDEKGLEAMIHRFMEEKNAGADFGAANPGPETADDYLELAMEAATKKKRLAYLDKALALDPDNLDAGKMKAELTVKSHFELLEKLLPLLEKGDQQMKKEGFFTKEFKGSFWGIVETRPYMRLRHAVMRSMTKCGMFRRAAKECEEMLALCEGDNLGVRYDLMHLYAMLEEEKPAKALMKKYQGNEETQMILPFSILHFKLGKMDEALEELKRLNEINKDTKKFLRAMMSGKMDNLLTKMEPWGYRPYCIEELAIEASNYSFLFENAISYFPWAQEKLKKEPARK